MHKIFLRFSWLFGIMVFTHVLMGRTNLMSNPRAHLHLTSVCTESLEATVARLQLLLHAPDTVPPVFDSIDFTRKSGTVVPVLLPDKQFPWLPVVGGVTGGGIVTYLVTRDKETVVAEFIVRTDNVTVPCDGSATIDVLANDSGEGLSITSVSPTGNASISTGPGGTLNISDINTTNSFSVMVTIENSRGQSATSTLNITVTVPPIQAVDDVFETEFETPLSGNVLTNDSGNLTVSSHTQPSGGSATIAPNGNISFTPDPGFQGSTSFTYTVVGPCDQTSDGTVTITVAPPDCAFDATFETTPAPCGTADGMATVTVTPSGNYTYLWSSGGATETESLGAGTHTLTVTDVNGCSKVFELTIDELPPEFDATFETIPASCGVADGTATVVPSPDGDYTFLWSNGIAEAAAESLTGSEFSITVTDANGCSKSFSVVVPENPADYLDQITSTPGNCLGDGADIALNLNTPGTGPMQIDAEGPDGMQSVSAPAGLVNLSSSFTVKPGQWSITITDQSIESRCSTETQINVDDNTVLEVVDDSYETLCDEPVSQNVLDNDNGLHLTVTDHTEPTGGQLTIAANGLFTFTPPVGQTGDFAFTYTARDTCGNESAANVVIIVNPKDCLFEATFDTTSAHCGIADGMIVTTMEPAGNYTYLWSEGSTTADLSGINAGTYSVTITSEDLNCDQEYSVTIDEIPGQYLFAVQTTPGNCVGGGTISFELTTPGDGPLVIEIDGPQGMTSQTLPDGPHTLTDLASGNYVFTVYDQGAGASCSQSIDITIPDNTTPANANDDLYETPFNTPLSANVLDNDMGLGLQLTDIANIVGGTVDHASSGLFTFTPADGFSGTGGFDYTATDTCGNTTSAIVVIEVMPGVCDFTPQFFVTNASCGLGDGQVTVDVLEPGDYLYEWDNGVQGPTIDNVFPGTYTVTITDVNLDCSLVFSTDVGEDPAEYISGVDVIQPQCPSSGEIFFTVSTPDAGPMEMEVTHPGGTDNFPIPTGQIMLSDYIPIAEGDYTIVVTDVSAGPGCMDSFMATISSGTSLQISLVEVIPPSGPTGMDGSIVIAVDIPGTEPYTVLVNEVVWGVVTGDTVTIEGVGGGTYTIQLLDANECPSNVLVVDVPFTVPNLSLGFGYTLVSHADWEVEMPASESTTRLAPVFMGSFEFPLAGLTHEISAGLINGKHLVPRLRYLANVANHQVAGIRVEGQLGLMYDFLQSGHAKQWTLQGRFSTRIADIIALKVTGGVQGWKGIDRPAIEVTWNVPMRFGQKAHATIKGN